MTKKSRTADLRSTACEQVLDRRFVLQVPGGAIPSRAIHQHRILLKALARKEAFVTQALGGGESAWDLPMTFERFGEPKLTDLGERFYELMSYPWWLKPETRGQLGAKQRLFDSVALEFQLPHFGLQRSAFATLQPQAPTEGAVTNAFTERLRELGEKKTFREDDAKSRKEARQLVREVERELSVLAASVPALFGTWVMLEYLMPDATTSPLDIASATAQFRRFCNLLQDLPAPDQHVAYAWWRSYLPEVGYRYYVLLLDTYQRDTSTDMLGTRLTKLWLEVTQNRGSNVSPVSPMGLVAIQNELKAMELAERIITSVKPDEVEESQGYFFQSVYGI